MSACRDATFQVCYATSVSRKKLLPQSGRYPQEYAKRFGFTAFNMSNIVVILLYAFFWVVPRHQNNSDAGRLPGRKHTTFRTRRKFEIKNE